MASVRIYPLRFYNSRCSYTHSSKPQYSSRSLLANIIISYTSCDAKAVIDLIPGLFQIPYCSLHIYYTLVVAEPVFVALKT